MASKRGVRRRQCGSKLKLTKDEAFRKAVALRKSKPGQVYDGYPCSHCGNGIWHVGHRPRKVQQSINSRRRVSNG